MNHKIYKVLTNGIKNNLAYSLTPVKAGFPSPAEDLMIEHLDLNEFLIQHPASTFLMKVSGSSMVNAGIFDGDILVVDKSLEPYNGCVGIAALNGEFTVKRIKKFKNELFLMPENPEYKPIKVDSELDIWGVVKFSIHSIN